MFVDKNIIKSHRDMSVLLSEGAFFLGQPSRTFLRELDTLDLLCHGLGPWSANVGSVIRALSATGVFFVVIADADSATVGAIHGP